jgi:hypothetical protein
MMMSMNGQMMKRGLSRKKAGGEGLLKMGNERLIRPKGVLVTNGQMMAEQEQITQKRIVMETMEQLVLLRGSCSSMLEMLTDHLHLAMAEVETTQK